MEMSEILNPRGQVAKQLEASIRRASWLALLCEYWLSFNDDNTSHAATYEPTYDLPKGLPNATRFNKARKECGAYTPNPVRVPSIGRRHLKSGVTKYLRGNKDVNDIESTVAAEPMESKKWDWSWVFHHWHSGGLQRSIDDMMEMLPEENQVRLRKEFTK